MERKEGGEGVKEGRKEGRQVRKGREILLQHNQRRKKKEMMTNPGAAQRQNDKDERHSEEKRQRKDIGRALVTGKKNKSIRGENKWISAVAFSRPMGCFVLFITSSSNLVH